MTGTIEVRALKIVRAVLAAQAESGSGYLSDEEAVRRVEEILATKEIELTGPEPAGKSDEDKVMGILERIAGGSPWSRARVMAEHDGSLVDVAFLDAGGSMVANFGIRARKGEGPEPYDWSIEGLPFAWRVDPAEFARTIAPIIRTCTMKSRKVGETPAMTFRSRAKG